MKINKLNLFGQEYFRSQGVHLTRVVITSPSYNEQKQLKYAIIKSTYKQKSDLEPQLRYGANKMGNKRLRRVAEFDSVWKME